MTNEEVYGAITALLENAVDMEDEKHEEVFARTLAMLDENSMMHDISVEYEKKLKEILNDDQFKTYQEQQQQQRRGRGGFGGPGGPRGQRPNM